MGGVLAAAVGRALAVAALLPGDVLLVSSGRTVYEVAQCDLVPLPGMLVAPTVGGNDQLDEWYQPNEITRLVANRIGGRPNYLFARRCPGRTCTRRCSMTPAFNGCCICGRTRVVR